jgi:hypothetical protein
MKSVMQRWQQNMWTSAKFSLGTPDRSRGAAAETGKVVNLKKASSCHQHESMQLLKVPDSGNES